MAPLIPAGPTPDEELATVTPEEIEMLKSRFHEQVKANNADFDQEDLDRVNTDKLWLRRFIAHSEFKMDEAVKMLYETCQWRKEFGTNQLDHTKLPAHVLEKGILFVRNQDKWGKKLLMFKAKQHQKGVEDFETVKKFIVYYFERIERASKSEQISIIFDMKDTGWSNMDMDFIRYLITILKQYYPFFVNYLIIFEMPWLLKSAWNIIKGWLPAKFVDRVKFLDKKTISEFIDLDNQLVEWGGNDSYTYKWEPEVRVKRQAADEAPKAPLTNGNQSQRSSSQSQDPEIREEQVVRRRTAPQPVNAKVQVEDQHLSKGDKWVPNEHANGTSNHTAQIHRDDSSSSSDDDEGGDGRMTSPASRSPTPSSPAQTPTTPRDLSRIINEEEAIDDRSPLVKVDSVVKFEREPSGAGGADINGSFHIENIANGKAAVLFKVKTTDPSKFRVRPTIGVIDYELQATVNINVLDGVTLHHIGRERFQVQATTMPKEYRALIANSVGVGGNGGSTGTNDVESVAGNRSSGSNYSQLNNVWKQIVGSPDVYLETHRMTCRLDPSLLPAAATAVQDNGEVIPHNAKSTINKEDTKRALDQLEQKITTSFNSTLNEKFDYIIKLIYGLFAFVFLAALVLWISL